MYGRSASAAALQLHLSPLHAQPSEHSIAHLEPLSKKSQRAYCFAQGLDRVSQVNRTDFSDVWLVWGSSAHANMACKRPEALMLLPLIINRVDTK